jgi:hypothetical protein
MHDHAQLAKRLCVRGECGRKYKKYRIYNAKRDGHADIKWRKRKVHKGE